MSKASQYLFALPAPWCGVQGTSQRRVPAPTADLPPRPCNSFRPSTSAQPSRLPIPVRSGQGSPGIQYCRASLPTDRPALALHHPHAFPLVRALHPHRQASNREVSVRPGSSLSRNYIHLLPPGHGLPAHPPRALVLSLDRRAPRFRPYGSHSQDFCSAIPLTAATTTQPSYNHSSAVVFPGGGHSTAVAVPSSPPTTVRHAPPDVEAFFTTSLLPKDLACVVVPRQPPEGRIHSPGPHTALL